MHQGGLKTFGVHDGQALFKQCGLLRGFFRITDRREMSAHAFQPEMLAGSNRRTNAGQGVHRNTKAGHPGIDLKVNRENRLVSFGGPVESFHMPRFPDDRREMVGDDLVFFAPPEACHEE